ncbi:DUF5462 family protein [Providencia sp. SP181]|uniref:DUF5462 family protein n=1 Tax=Providencia sp. SP181 TaxID=3136277 RepID=UPI003D277FB6
MRETVMPLAFRSRGIFFALLGALMGVGLGSSALAQERQLLEALGVVNGSMTTRHSGVEIMAFLSGQPLFSLPALSDGEGVSTLLIEHAQLTSQDGKTLQLQQSFSLPQGQEGYWQLPVHVQVNGKAVAVTAKETSLGVQLMLPADAHSVAVVPVGAATLFVPAAYRGDISIALRITGETEE